MSGQTLTRRREHESHVHVGDLLGDGISWKTGITVSYATLPHQEEFLLGRILWVWEFWSEGAVGSGL